MSTSISSFPVDVTPITAYPTKDPTDATFGGTTFRTSAGNAVRIAGKCTAGAGSVYLLEWDGTYWHPVDLDSSGTKQVPVNSAAPADAAIGRFGATWLSGETGQAWYCVLVTGGPTLTPLRAYQRRV